MLIEQKVLIIEKNMTQFWRERWGYNIHQNEQKHFFWPRPPYTLNKGAKLQFFRGFSKKSQQMFDIFQ